MSTSIVFSQLRIRLSSLRTCASDVRLQYSASVEGFIDGLFFAHVITEEQFDALKRLALSAYFHSGEAFVSTSNAGPVMTPWIAYERSRVKPSAQVTANEEPEPVSAPAAPRSLQLLCLLVPSRTGEQRSLPVHGMPPLPPRRGVTGRWSMGLPAGLSLRETHAAPPSPEVLARCVRQRKAHPVRAHLRTV